MMFHHWNWSPQFDANKITSLMIMRIVPRAHPLFTPTRHKAIIRWFFNQQCPLIIPKERPNWLEENMALLIAPLDSLMTTWHVLGVIPWDSWNSPWDYPFAWDPDPQLSGSNHGRTWSNNGRPGDFKDPNLSKIMSFLWISSTKKNTSNLVLLGNMHMCVYGCFRK